MNEVPDLVAALPENKRKIIEVMLQNPALLLDLGWFKSCLCGPGGMSERRLRSNLKELEKKGVLGRVGAKDGRAFYGFPNVVNDPVMRAAALKHTGPKGKSVGRTATIISKPRVELVTPEFMVANLLRAKEHPVIRPTGRSAKQRRAQLKNYLTAIDWQIYYFQQMIAKRELEARRKEIEDKYGKPCGAEDGS